MMDSQRTTFAAALATAIGATGVVAAQDAQAQLVFTDITQPSLTIPGQSSRGAAWVDFDNDGDLDLFVTVWAAPNHLFRNDGGVFTDITGNYSDLNPVLDLDDDGVVAGMDLAAMLAAWGTPGGDVTGDSLTDGADLAMLLAGWNPDPINPVAGNGTNYSGQAVWADADNDGDMDVYWANSGANVMLRNDHPLGFTEVTAPPVDHSTLGRGSAWADWNNDGLVELYETATGGRTLESRLFIAMGDLTYSMINVGPLANYGTGRGVAWADFDNDGDLDFYVANGSPGGDPIINTTNRLFRNNGDGTFTDVAATMGVDDVGNSRGVAWGDYDGDGWLDLMVVNVALDFMGSENQLFRNVNGVSFTNETIAAGVYDAGGTRDCAWLDIDNDGDLDLFTVGLNSSNVVYLNQGDGTFVDGTPPTLQTNLDSGYAGAWADIDDDGDLDVFITYKDISNQLIRNDLANGNHWIQVELTGASTSSMPGPVGTPASPKPSNRSAIGARVTITTGGVSQMREVHSGSGYLTQHMLRLHFGLGSATVIDSLVIEWPGGYTQTMLNVGVDQILSILEPVTEEGPLDEAHGSHSLSGAIDID